MSPTTLPPHASNTVASPPSARANLTARTEADAEKGVHDEENHALRDTTSMAPRDRSRARWWVEFAGSAAAGLVVAGVVKWVWDVPATRCR